MILGSKSLKKLLLELGFHHSWGYWILNGLNNEKNDRVKFDKGFIYPTHNYNHFNHSDRIHYRNESKEIIRQRLVEYFKIL
jgi:hypothetical protein